jgi:hypothetical protein
MRWIVWLVALLVGLVWLASEIPLPARQPAPVNQPCAWRKTRDGWERATWMSREPEPRRPSLHPSVVSVFQFVLSVGALAAFPTSAKRF